MTTANILPELDKFLDFVVEKATPEEILALTISEEAQQCAEELTERNKSGILTPEEAIELEKCLLLDEWVSLLKAKALKALKK